MATMTNQKAKTQDALKKAALQQLAVIGGAMTNDDQITFEGRKYVFPEQYQGDLVGLLRDVTRYVEGQEERIVVDRVFDYRPNDGAYATMMCLKEFFGYALSVPINTFFGKQPPEEQTIDIGFFEGTMRTVTVPWGCLALPGIKDAKLYTKVQRDPAKGMLFRLAAECRRADKPIVDGFFQVVADYMASNSIYRGHAVHGNMEFFDTDKIRPEKFVFTDDVWAQAETNILSPLCHSDVLRANGLSLKRVVLLEGPFGSGKSGLGRSAAKVAVENGRTAIIARPGSDNPFEVLQTAVLYQPALVFIEDVDTFSMQQDPQYVTKLLDAFDGFSNKELEITLVLTTNHVDRIHKGMLRPGRLDAVIHIGEMDRQGVERLTHIVLDGQLEDNIDFDKVYEATLGFMPAFVKEALERALRYTIARTGTPGPVSTDDLIHTCNSLRAQQALQDAAQDTHEKLPPLEQMFGEIVEERSAAVTPDMLEQVVDNRVVARMDTSTIFDRDGQPKYSIRVNQE